MSRYNMLMLFNSVSLQKSHTRPQSRWDKLLNGLQLQTRLHNDLTLIWQLRTIQE